MLNHAVWEEKKQRVQYPGRRGAFKDAGSFQDRDVGEVGWQLLDAHAPRAAEVQFKAAQPRHEVEGDRKGAIEQCPREVLAYPQREPERSS